MNKKQESKLSMYLAVRDFLLQNSENTKDVPNFEANFTEFRDTINQIQSNAEVQKSDFRGYAKEKMKLRQELVNHVLENSFKLNAYAMFKGDLKLQSASKITRGKLLKAPDTGVRDYAQIIYDMAQKMIDNLPEYGITKESQAALNESISKYNASLSGPRVARTENVQSTRQMTFLFEHADMLLESISIAIGIIRLAKPLFYKGFETARKIIITGSSSYALKGMAVDSKNGHVLKGARFIFSPQKEAFTSGEIVKEIVRKTRGKGSFLIKTIPQGVYSVKVSKPGYQEKIVSVVVSEGEMTEMKVELEAA